MKQVAREENKSNRIIPLSHPSTEAASEGNAGRTKIIELLPDRVSIEKLRPIWNDKEVTYTDEELFRIREWLYVVAEVTISEFDRRKHANHTIPLNQLTEHHIHLQQSNEPQKSHSLRPRIHRRAS